MKTIATESIYEEIIEAAAAWWVKNLHHLHVCKNLLEQKEDKHTFKEGLVDFLQKQSERMEMRYIRK